MVGMATKAAGGSVVWEFVRDGGFGVFGWRVYESDGSVREFFVDDTAIFGCEWVRECMPFVVGVKEGSRRMKMLLDLPISPLPGLLSFPFVFFR